MLLFLVIRPLLDIGVGFFDLWGVEMVSSPVFAEIQTAYVLRNFSVFRISSLREDRILASL